MELELLRRYGGVALGTALGLLVFWAITRGRTGPALGLPRRTTRQLVWMALAMATGLASFIVLDRTDRSVLPWVAFIGVVGILALAGIQVRRHPEQPLPRTDVLLRWSIPIALGLLLLGLASRAFLGPGAVYGLVGGLGLGLLPGIVLLALFTLVTRVSSSARH